MSCLMLAALFSVATIGLALPSTASVAFDSLHVHLAELRQDPVGCNAPDNGPGAFGVTAGSLDRMAVAQAFLRPAWTPSLHGTARTK